jgi:uncharacterized protein (DUF4415 family)
MPPAPRALLRKKMKGDTIGLSGIAGITDWRKGVVGTFCRPIEESITIRLDAEVLARWRSGGKRYQILNEQLPFSFVLRRLPEGL